MTLFELLNRIFSRDNIPSKSIAKERLRLVLIHDRSTVTPEFLNALKEDLIKVIREYLDIDENGLQVNFENEDSSIALVANIPVRGFRRNVK
jgi:cell division topological specificity factor